MITDPERAMYELNDKNTALQDMEKSTCHLKGLSHEISNCFSSDSAINICA